MGERQEIGGYQLLEQIGYGGMSTVYKAQDGGGNRVALKLLHPALANSAGRERLAREVAMLLRVKGSRVAQVLDAETDGEDAFIVTELIDGPTLEQDVAENGVYGGDDLADLAEELTQAVRSIHTAEVLHRDLKPSNVMMSADGPVLIDFGIAQLGDDSRLTQAGALAQTPGYCDSRVVRGAQPDEEADWWALAAVLLFAATGRPPFGTGTTDTILKRVLEGHADVAGLDAPIAQAFLAALAPKNRIATNTLIDVLRHPEQAAQLLPSRSENPTQILSDERTRVYETAPEQEQKQASEAEPTEVISYDATEVVDTQSFANQYDEPIADSDIPSFYYDSGRELEQTMPYEQPLIVSRHREEGETPDEVISHGEFATSVASLIPRSDEQLDEPVPPWARPAPKSSWLILLLGLTLSTYGSVWLGVASLLYAFFLIFCGTWGFSSQGLRERRLERGGIYPRDRIGVVVRLPWAFLRTVLLSVLSVIVGIAAFVLTLFLLRTFLADTPIIPQTSGGKIPLPSPVFIGISFFVFLLLSWLFPANRQGREGARFVVKSLAPSWGYKLFWTIIFIGVITVGVILVGNISYIEWLPLPDISSTFPQLFRA